VPMFNTVYADREHVFYVYNGLLGKRAPGFDYTRVLPGDRSDVIFRDYLAFDALPQVLDPPSGFVQSCNATLTPSTATKASRSTSVSPIGCPAVSPRRHQTTSCSISTAQRTRSLVSGIGSVRRL